MTHGLKENGGLQLILAAKIGGMIYGMGQNDKKDMVSGAGCSVHADGHMCVGHQKR